MIYKKNVGNSNIPIPTHIISIVYSFPYSKANILVSYIYGNFSSIYNQKSEENYCEYWQASHHQMCDGSINVIIGD